MKIGKCLLFIILLSSSINIGFSRTFAGAWYGAGYSLHDNYDLGVSYGLNFYKGVGNGIGMGFTTFVQQLSLNTTTSINNFNGGTIGLTSKYLVFAPMVVVNIGKSGHLSGYFNAGVCMYQDGYVNIHTWSNVKWPQNSSYDTVQKGSSYLSTLTARLGIGLMQYYNMFGSFHVYINEDIGIFPVSLQNNLDSNPYIGNLKDNLNQFFSPTYISLRVGFAYITKSKTKRR